jgi:hypothetical protein
LGPSSELIPIKAYIYQRHVPGFRNFDGGWGTIRKHLIGEKNGCNFLLKYHEEQR